MAACAELHSNAARIRSVHVSHSLPRISTTLLSSNHCETCSSGAYRELSNQEFLELKLTSERLNVVGVESLSDEEDTHHNDSNSDGTDDDLPLAGLRQGNTAGSDDDLSLAGLRQDTEINSGDDLPLHWFYTDRKIQPTVMMTCHWLDSDRKLH
ncbi:uncharacterized protein [Ptychodera flava]|uniref:uncharacterized protein n=1 Tax=Ptychodera flava TaxID=63121 RepID=UPI00396A0271